MNLKEAHYNKFALVREMMETSDIIKSFNPATDTYVLSCGKEDAVAATKSVIEQGLFYDSLLRNLRGEKMEGLKELAEKTEQVLTAGIDKGIIDIIKNAGVIYFAGRETAFPTIKIPESNQYYEYLQLTAGWNILVETGVALGIDLDHPKRARKVGNEYVHE